MMVKDLTRVREALVGVRCAGAVVPATPDAVELWQTWLAARDVQVLFPRLDVQYRGAVAQVEPGEAEHRVLHGEYPHQAQGERVGPARVAGGEGVRRGRCGSRWP